MALAVGIDLGTSNSCVAAIVDGKPVVLADAAGRRTQPSVVAFGYGNAVVVGHRARQQLSYAPENTVHSAKRLIGRRFNSPEVDKLREHVAWGIAEGPYGDARIRVQGRVITAPEVSGRVLQHMKKIAEDALGDTVDRAVITVPAWFNDQQRQATRDAAELAGLECLRVLNEPTAAAVAYGFGQGRRQYIAVYDLGGGTFDMSVLRIEDDLFEVVSTSGDSFLGGDDFDDVIADHLRAELERVEGVDLTHDFTARTKLREAAERAKITLTDIDSVEVRIPNVARVDGGRPIHLNSSLNRTTLAQLAAPLLQRSFLVCDDALKQANLAAQQMDRVLLVGGMTRSPLVNESVTRYFSQTPDTTINPDEVVAVGAALQAHALTTFMDGPSALLLDVTPRTLGIRMAGGFLDQLIPRNTSVPAEVSKIFYTAHDGQTEVRIQVFQGEERYADANEPLGEFVLAGINPRPRGEVRIEVTFAIDSDGILQVSAEDLGTKRRQAIRIEATGGLSREEVETMRLDGLVTG